MKLIALITLAASLAGCEVVTGRDAKGNGFTAIGFLTKPEIAKARFGDFEVQGYSRGIDAAALGAIVGAAVKAAK